MQTDLMQVLVEPQQKETEHRRARQVEAEPTLGIQERSQLCVLLWLPQAAPVLLVQSQRHFAMTTCNGSSNPCDTIPVRNTG